MGQNLSARRVISALDAAMFAQNATELRAAVETTKTCIASFQVASADVAEKLASAEKMLQNLEEAKHLEEEERHEAFPSPPRDCPSLILAVDRANATTEHTVPVHQISKSVLLYLYRTIDALAGTRMALERLQDRELMLNTARWVLVQVYKKV